MRLLDRTFDNLVRVLVLFFPSVGFNCVFALVLAGFSLFRPVDFGILCEVLDLGFKLPKKYSWGCHSLLKEEQNLRFDTKKDKG